MRKTAGIAVRITLISAKMCEIVARISGMRSTMVESGIARKTAGITAKMCATVSSSTGTAAATSHNALAEPVAVAVAIKMELIEGAVVS